jgi:hypothetical protein
MSPNSKKEGLRAHFPKLFSSPSASASSAASLPLGLAPSLVAAAATTPFPEIYNSAATTMSTAPCLPPTTLISSPLGS